MVQLVLSLEHGVAFGLWSAGPPHFDQGRLSVENLSTLTDHHLLRLCFRYV